MKKYIPWSILFLFCLLSGCSQTQATASSVSNAPFTSSLSPFPEVSPTVSEKQNQPSEALQKTEENQLPVLTVTVGNQNFTAELHNNEAVNALLEQLPLAVHMSELNGNEKYYYLDQSLPADAIQPDGIHNGDLMLYGSDCLVLFYKNFSTAYRYTPLGHITNPEGLTEALGKGDITITFQIS